MQKASWPKSFVISLPTFHHKGHMDRETIRKCKIVTVQGAISAEQLGPTLMHEHILCDLTPPGQFDPNAQEVEITLENVWEIRYHWCEHLGNNRLNDSNIAVSELQRMREAGGRSIVDLTSTGMKRNPLDLLNISQKAGVNIIMGCGFYIEDTLPIDVREQAVEGIAEEMISEFNDGVNETGVRPGIIGEMGCSYPWSETERRMMQAAVLTQKETGAAINVHPGRHPKAPLEVIRFIEKNGGDPSRVIISHVDRTIFDINTLLDLAETSCIIEYDFFGIESSYYPYQDIDLPNDGIRLRFIRTLIDKGYLTQILISQDICTKTRLIAYGGHGYGHIFRNVIPIMRRRSFSDSEIDTILVENPRRILTFV